MKELRLLDFTCKSLAIFDKFMAMHSCDTTLGREKR
jgi:hypothetical protein